MTLENKQGTPALGWTLQTPRAQTSATTAFGTTTRTAAKTPGLDNITLPSPLSRAHASLKKESPILNMLIPQAF